jgi:hypothetical protein
MVLVEAVGALHPLTVFDEIVAGDTISSISGWQLLLHDWHDLLRFLLHNRYWNVLLA